MGLGDMFYNGKTQSRASKFAASGFVRPVESFKKSWKMLFCDSNPVILNADNNRIIFLTG
jgi:hypothetical protein